MAKSPAFQMYPADFLSDRNVLVMTAEEVGAYVMLLLSTWLEGALSNDLDELAAIAKMPRDRFEIAWEKRIARCFEQREDGAWIHPRLEVERQKQQEFREKRRIAGKAGGEARAKHKPSKRQASAKQTPSFISSSIPVVADAPDFKNWPSTFGAEWARARKGGAPFARIGTALKGLIERDGPETHWPAWCVFVASDKARFGPEYFVNNRRDFDPPPPKLAMTTAGTPVMSPAEMEAYKRAEIAAINEHRRARGDGPLVA